MKQHIMPVLITLVIIAVVGNSAMLSNIILPSTKPLP